MFKKSTFWPNKQNSVENVQSFEIKIDLFGSRSGPTSTPGTLAHCIEERTYYQLFYEINKMLLFLQLRS